METTKDDDIPQAQDDVIATNKQTKIDTIVEVNQKESTTSTINKSSPKNETDTIELNKSCTNGGNTFLPAAPHPDPLPTLKPSHVRENDHILLHFGDDRRIFAHCVKKYKGKAPLKINKRTYNTCHLIGLPYGTVLELGTKNGQLTALPAGEDIVPSGMDDFLDIAAAAAAADSTLLPPSSNDNNNNKTTTTTSSNDNRNLIDSNTSQSLEQKSLEAMRDTGCAGDEIVAALIKNSATFDKKTKFSQAKYVNRKRKKYQPRCRIVRCTGPSICETLYFKDARRIMNLRTDTLAQILSYANVCAGAKVLVYEQCMGIITGSLAQRMGGYGRIYSAYATHAPGFTELIDRFNLSYAAISSVSWVPVWDLFPDGENNHDIATLKQTDDADAKERDAVIWPTPIQPHTRSHLEQMSSDTERRQFLQKRSHRFARKLTRPTARETMTEIRDKVDALIVATRHDPIQTLIPLLETYLSSSAPFVCFCEFREPLQKCFLELQKRRLAINIRLTECWMRDYQVLEGRTHPQMNMRQSGGYLLTGVVLSKEYGRVEVDDEVVKKYREKLGGRRGKKKKTTPSALGNDAKEKEGSGASSEERDSKRTKIQT